MLTLDVNIATHRREGIERVAAMKLPRVEGVRYVVSWQLPDGDLPVGLLRDDVDVYRLDLPGVSRNRNNALDHSTADLCLLADDDLLYTPQQLKEVIATFERNPDTVLAAFRYDPPGRKPYPDTVTDISRGFPKSHGGVTTIELAFRRRIVVGAGVRFCELAGPGAPVLQAAEDELFLEAVKRKRLRCVYYPFTVCRHCGGMPTGARPLSAGAVKAGGAVIAVTHPWTAALRIPLWAWRRWRRGQFPLLPGIAHLTHGAIYAWLHRLP